jgi:hypothetical protein
VNHGEHPLEISAGKRREPVLDLLNASVRHSERSMADYV